MAFTRQDCMNAAMAAGATQQQADDIVNEMLANRQRIAASGQAVNAQTLAQAWNSQTARMEMAAYQRKREAAINAVRWHEITTAIDAMKTAGASPEQAIQAYLVGKSSYFQGARNSISAYRKGILKSWFGPMLNELEQAGDGMAMDLLRRDKSYHDDVIREMREPGSTQNQGAKELAQIFSKYMEQARTQLNSSGANIGKLENWAPQNHDSEKLLKAGVKDWVDFIQGKIDWERTFDGEFLTDQTGQKEILARCFDDICLGKPGLYVNEHSLDFTDIQKPSAISKKLEHSRVLHFKSADDAIEYNDRFGRGNLFDAMLGSLDRSSRVLSILDRLGTRPQGIIEKILQREESLIRQSDTLTETEKSKKIKKIQSLMQKGWTNDGPLSRWMAELTGEVNMPVNKILQKAGLILRGIQTLSKLGAASISAIADVFVKASGMRFNGETWGNAFYNAIQQYFERYGTDKKRVAREVGAFIESTYGIIQARYDTDVGLQGVFGRMQDKLFRWSGLNWMTEQGKGGYSMWFSQHLADLAQNDLASMGANGRAMLNYHGITAEKWEAMRSLVREFEGKKYLVPDEAMSVSEDLLLPLIPENLRERPDFTGVRDADAREVAWQAARDNELARARRNLQFDTMALISDETGFAIIEPDDATMSIMRQGHRPGTWAGEFWRAAMQIKSFPIAYMQRILGGRRWIRAERQPSTQYGFSWGSAKDFVFKDINGITGMILSSFVFGYIAAAAKDVTKGRSIRDPRKMETIYAALMQAGGAGIFGDFMFGNVNRFGGGLGDTLMGPGISGTLSNVSNLVKLATHAEGEAFGEDLLRNVMADLPFVNLWFTRAALDWGLLYHIREWASPGALQRSERKMKEDFGQTFLVSPSKYIKYGGRFKENVPIVGGTVPLNPLTWVKK